MSITKNKRNLLTLDSSGLVLFLDAENPASYPGTGFNWYDLSPEGNDCVLDATHPPVYNPKTKLFEFLASRQNKAAVVNDATLNFGTGDFTILHYSEHPIIGDAVGSVMYKGARFDINRAGWLVTSHAGNALYQVISDGSQRIEMWFPYPTTSTFTKGVYGLMRRGGLIYCIYDGVVNAYFPTNGAQSTDFTMNVDSTNDISIGYTTLYNSYWNGNIGKIILYNRGISDDELLSIKQQCDKPLTNTTSVYGQTILSNAPSPNPYADKLYVALRSGGANSLGTLNSYEPLTNTLTTLFAFTSSSGDTPNGTLLIANKKIYGMTRLGGASAVGVLFEYNRDTSTYTKKFEFTGTTGAHRGAQPYGFLIEGKRGKLYGMTRFGGTLNLGTLFEYDYVHDIHTVKVDMTGNSGLYQGSSPFGGLYKASNGKLYGMTFQGGSNNTGVIFEYDMDTSTYTVKYNIVAGVSGSNPQGSLIEYGGELYGMTFVGGFGAPSAGTIFKFNYNTNALTILYNFSGGSTTGGGNPAGSLLEINGILYGLTRLGGTGGAGVIFKFNIATSTYTKLHDFSTTVGTQPLGNLKLFAANGKLYGLTSAGGTNGQGVIFEFDLNTNTYTEKIDLSLTIGGSPQYVTFV